MNQADVPSIIEKLAAKIVDWKKNQEAETQEMSTSINCSAWYSRF